MPARRFAAQMGGAFALQVAGVLCGYLLHVFLARFMGPAPYGTYVYVVAWTNLLAVVAGLGLPAACLRFVAEYSASGAANLLNGVLRRSSQLTILSGALVALASGWAVRHVQIAGINRDTFALGLWLIPLVAILNLQTEIARGLGWVTLSQGPSKVLRPALVAAGSLSFWSASGSVGADAALRITVAAVLLTALVQAFRILQRLPPAVREAAPRYASPTWLRVASPLLIESSFVLLLGQLDVMMIGMFLDSTQVGIYSAASRVATLISFFLFSANVVAAPRYAALHSQGNADALQHLLVRVAHFTFWPSLLATLLIVVFAQPLLALFGVEFTAALWELRILAATELMRAMIGPVGYILNLTGHQDRNARILAGAAVLDLLLNGIAIPSFGIRGAAAATATTWLVALLWQQRSVERSVGVRCSILSALGRGRTASGGFGL